MMLFKTNRYGTLCSFGTQPYIGIFCVTNHATYHLKIISSSGVQGVPRGEGEGRQGAGGQDEVLQHHPGQDRREGDRLRSGLTRETPTVQCQYFLRGCPDSV